MNGKSIANAMAANASDAGERAENRQESKVKNLQSSRLRIRREEVGTKGDGNYAAIRGTAIQSLRASALRTAWQDSFDALRLVRRRLSRFDQDLDTAIGCIGLLAG